MANSQFAPPGSKAGPLMGVPEADRATEQALHQRIAQLEQQVSELREANENLVLATVSAQTLRDCAEDSNRRQNEFLAMLAHELRNPLAPISMSATLLERAAGADPSLVRLTQVVRRQVDHMAHLLNDLLDAARISSGKISLSPEPLRLGEVIDQAVETVLPRIRERRQHLKLDLADMPLVVVGDRVRLTQVFSNLLGNASKYTQDEGSIVLSASGGGGQITVSIADNGAGIAPEVLPHIFDLFTQGPRSLARSEGGLGVGLNVVRNVVGLHAGTVHAESAGSGQGSRFTVTLPRCSDMPDLAGPDGPRQRAGAPLRILLVEDNVDAGDTLEALLRMDGHDVRRSMDGPSGLEAARSEAFDAIVCDIGLPGMDGYQLMEQLRAGEGGRRARAIALTGYGQAEDRERALAAGFDDYLVKPVNAERLLGLLAPADKAAPQA